MEPMLAGQLCDLFANINLVHTYAALGLVLVAKHIFGNLLAWKSINVILGGWRWGIAAGGLLHEL
jgi:hypothetical protein